MCLNPITIPTQTRYVSLKYRDSYLFDVGCGHCAECADTVGRQWYYRAWYEWNSLPSDGYCLFDCLTYSPKYLPHLSDFWTLLDKKHEDYPCFNPNHLRKFLQLLRQRLIRAGYRKDSFRYFLATEYGTDKVYNGRKATNRPHIHIMLYIYDGRIDALWLSRLIAELWQYGRTDGVPYKSAYYVMSHNVIPSSNQLANKLRTCNYVTKYVQKSCLFQKELNKRLDKVMWRLAEYAAGNFASDWLETEIAHRERLKLMRYVNQFHRQSQHFGESALADLDLLQLEKDGCLWMPDFKKVKIPVPLPLYYKRKLMQQLVNVDGARYWVNTEYGEYYKKVRKKATMQVLSDRYQCLVDEFKLPIKDVPRLVEYIFETRGRLKYGNEESTLEQRLADCDIYNYATSSDKLQFGCRGLSQLWLGDSQRGYNSRKLHKRISLQQFIRQHCCFDEELEQQLTLIKSKLGNYNHRKQKAYELRQELRNKFKPYL